MCFNTKNIPEKSSQKTTVPNRTQYPTPRYHRIVVRSIVRRSQQGEDAPTDLQLVDNPSLPLDETSQHLTRPLPHPFRLVPLDQRRLPIEDIQLKTLHNRSCLTDKHGHQNRHSQLQPPCEVLKYWLEVDVWSFEARN